MAASGAFCYGLFLSLFSIIAKSNLYRKYLATSSSSVVEISDYCHHKMYVVCV